MKKFYAFAAAAMMTASAFAQAGAPLYITGGTTGAEFPGGNWNPVTPDEFTYDAASNTYTFEQEGLSMFKVSTACGDWDTFNEKAIGIADFTKEMLGVATPLVPWGENTMCPWPGDYKIVIAGDLSTMTLTTTTPEPSGIEIFLRGDMNGWGSPAEWMFEEIGEKMFKLTCGAGQLIAVGESFKIADAGWATYNYGNAGEDYELDTPMDVTYNGQNMALTEEWDGVCFFNLADLQVMFSNDKDAENPWGEVGAVSGINTENAAPVYYNLQGVQVENPANGLYIVVKGGKSFKTVK